MRVLVFARAPRRGGVRRALEPLLGVDGALRAHAALLMEAIDWARDLAPEALYVAYEPADAGPEIRALVGDDIIAFPQVGDGIAGRFRHAAGRVFEDHAGPVLALWPDVVSLARHHGTAALADLAAGADVVLGPAFDGGFYLIGLARPLPRLFGLDESAWRGTGAVGMAMAAALQSGPAPLEVGILRVERALHRPADVRAALADPLLSERFRRVLSTVG
ncbi:MAG TPA: DUF2064 domain-containing protein [Solirubrobacteraceae bacterium]|nr:DUF2064 domain-containing protein [Solirubrobacteraceae bacterium]